MAHKNGEKAKNPFVSYSSSSKSKLGAWKHNWNFEVFYTSSRSLRLKVSKHQSAHPQTAFLHPNRRLANPHNGFFSVFNSVENTPHPTKSLWRYLALTKDSPSSPDS